MVIHKLGANQSAVQIFLHLQLLSII